MPSEFIISRAEEVTAAHLHELTLSDLSLPAESRSSRLAKTFLSSAGYSMIQSPLNAVTQIVDNTCGTEILPKVQLVQQPERCEFGSLNWHAQELGNAAGMLVPFALLHTGLRAAAGKYLLADMNNRSGSLCLRKYANEVGLTAASGIVYGACFTPSDPAENIWAGRLKNGMEQGLTFATLAAGAGGLKLLGQSAGARLPARMLQNEVLSTTLAGIPAGCISADAHSVLSGKGLASWKDRAQSAYGFMFVGAGLGGLNRLRQHRNAPMEGSDRPADRTGNQNTELRPEQRHTDRPASREKVQRPLNTEAETYEQRRTGEKAEAEARLAEFKDRPNPASLAESCRKISTQLRQLISDTECRIEQQQEFTSKRARQFEDAAVRMEEYARESGPSATAADLKRFCEQLSESHDLIKRELREIAESNQPARLVLKEWGGYQYRIMEDGSCVRVESTSGSLTTKSQQVVFVDGETARIIKDLYEDGALAGKTFPASPEHGGNNTCPVQIGDARFSQGPAAVIENGQVTFPDVNGRTGMVLVGSETTVVDTPRTPAAGAAALAESYRLAARNSLQSGRSSLEYSTKELAGLRQILSAVEDFPQRFAEDNPHHIFDLPEHIRSSAPDFSPHYLQQLIELVYEHAPAQSVFVTEKGSVYRFYADRSLGRLKSDGLTRDRGDNQYFVEPSVGQALLDAANSDSLASLSIPVHLHPAVGLSPLSLHRAGNPPRVLPKLVEGRLVWPAGRWITFEGHVGHKIVEMRQLTGQVPAPSAH